MLARCGAQMWQEATDNHDVVEVGRVNVGRIGVDPDAAAGDRCMARSPMIDQRQCSGRELSAKSAACLSGSTIPVSDIIGNVGQRRMPTERSAFRSRATRSRSAQRSSSQRT